MCSNESGRIVFAGRSDGSVVAFDTMSGDFPFAEVHHARNDTFAEIMSFANDILAIANSAQVLQVWNVPTAMAHSGKPKFLFEKPYHEPIQQVLLSHDGQQLLVSTSTTDELLTVTSGSEIRIMFVDSTNRSQRKCWASIGHRLVMMGFDLSFNLYDWVSGEHCCTLHMEKQDTVAPHRGSSFIDSLSQTKSGQYLVAAWAPSHTNQSRTQLMSCTNPFAPGSAAITPTSNLLPATEVSLGNVRTFLGIYQEQVVFLDHDLWICSLKLGQVSNESPVMAKHIFIPPEFVSAPTAAKPFVTQQGLLVFSKDDKLAIVKGALDWSFG
jgi:hypothetical protein